MFRVSRISAVSLTHTCVQSQRDSARDKRFIIMIVIMIMLQGRAIRVTWSSWHPLSTSSRSWRNRRRPPSSTSSTRRSSPSAPRPEGHPQKGHCPLHPTLPFLLLPPPSPTTLPSSSPPHCDPTCPARSSPCKELSGNLKISLRIRSLNQNKKEEKEQRNNQENQGFVQLVVVVFFVCLFFVVLVAFVFGFCCFFSGCHSFILFCVVFFGFISC